MNDDTTALVPAAGLDVPTGHQIRTDRPCARCGFNLFGQTIVREAHYGLIAARCPECGQLAALQEYPALGKWADRWAKLLAALWVLFLLGAIGAHFGPMLGFSFALLESASTDLGNHIGNRYTESQQAVQGPTPNQQIFMGSGAWTALDADWWRGHRDEIVASYRSAQRPTAQTALYLYFLLGLGAFFNGVYWSVCLLGARRRTAALIALIPLTLAVVIVWNSGPTLGWSGPNLIMARDAARDVLKPRVLPPVLATLLISTMIGIWLGRRIARCFVRLSLPPRMRSALAILWTRDGLPTPTARCR